MGDGRLRNQEASIARTGGLWNTTGRGRKQKHGPVPCTRVTLSLIRDFRTYVGRREREARNSQRDGRS